MIIGVTMFVLAIFVIFVGTKDSEADVLYYDADFTTEDSESIGGVESAGGAEEVRVQEVVEEPTIPPMSEPSPKLVEEKSRPRGRSRAASSGQVSSMEEMQRVASASDPTSTAQKLFDLARSDKL